MITYSLVLFCIANVFGQKENPQVKGTIANYSSQPLRLYKCHGDTLLLIDSTLTDVKGAFVFDGNSFQSNAMYKILMPGKQFFYCLYDKQPIELKAQHQANAFYNIAGDSLVVLKSEVNKDFCQFQLLQKQLNVANYWLLQMMRLYPLPDPFHKQIEKEYTLRHQALEQFVKKQQTGKKANTYSMATKMALAYFQPIDPDWKQPDPWRDSIIAEHNFDFFNPADSFYLHTNILPEKMDLYLALRSDKRDAYGQKVNDENLVKSAAEDFLIKAKSNPENFAFCLNYLLKKFNKEHRESAFLYLYDKYGKPESGDCKSSNSALNWAQEKASVLKGIQPGSLAPDFAINDQLQLYGIKSDYTLVLFWASWCPHCMEEVPKIKKVIEGFQNQHKEIKFKSVFVSLDNDEKPWKDFIEKNALGAFFQVCEFKGWNGQTAKKYNVYATPTMFLLDKDKKIIAKPETTEQLQNVLFQK